MRRRFFLLVAIAAAVVPLRAAESDALAIDAQIQARHVPFGAILDPVFADPNSTQITAYTHCGDSALWTGHYIAAEAFRYNVTRAGDALNNLKSALAGLKTLVDVTGNSMLARCMVPANSPYLASIQSEEASNGAHTSGAWVWIGNTSRDQYVGAVFGLAVAYDFVDDAGVKSAAADLISRLVGYLSGHSWEANGSETTTFLVRPDELVTLLDILQHVDPNSYSAADALEKAALSGSVGVPIDVDTASVSSYFKFNLDYITFYNLIRLSGGSSSSFIPVYNKLRSYTAAHRNAWFDTIDRALNGANAARDAEALSLLDQWLERPRRSTYTDVSSQVQVCGTEACEPVPVPIRPWTDFLWQRDPFQLAGGDSRSVENAGIDYILPYWMGRYYGLTAAPVFAIQSAAAGNAGIAPGSLASIYGSNLASTTAQASSTVLPTSLGGVSLTVHDSAGIDRTAGLVYVSPSQINFEVPEGAATGPATFTLSSGSSAQANIQTVAPALFSANGTGSGVAAATAIRTIAGNPNGPQSPVQVYQCSGGTCSPVPIDVGLDTPVYLSLYGTGIRNRSALANVNVTINGISVPVLYAGPQNTFPGLDQINVPLVLELRGAGVCNVVTTVDGQVSNTVTIQIQ